MAAIPLVEQLLEAEKRKDFAAACRIVSKIMELTGKETARQWRHVDPELELIVEHDPTFWPCLASRAAQAEQIYAEAQEAARRRALKRLREADLCDFADALESGNYAALSF